MDSSAIHDSHLAPSRFESSDVRLSVVGVDFGDAYSDKTIHSDSLIGVDDESGGLLLRETHVFGEKRLGLRIGCSIPSVNEILVDEVRKVSLLPATSKTSEHTCCKASSDFGTDDWLNDGGTEREERECGECERNTFC